MATVIRIVQEIKGQCLGGLACNGGCCRNIIYNPDGSIVEDFCQHYNKSDGKCLIYDRRVELGYTGCPTFPTVTSFVMNNGLPAGCGYWLEETEVVEEV